MKTLKFTLSIIVMIAFLGLNDALGQWTTSGSNIYNTNTGNVGIGNNAPGTLLHVGKSMTEPTIKIQNFGSNGGATYQMTDNASGADWKFKATQFGGFKIRDQQFALDVMTFEANSIANAIYIDVNGDVAFSHNAPNGHGVNVINYNYGKGAVYGADQNGSFLYAFGMLGTLDPASLGAPNVVYNAGVMGVKPALGANGAGVYGWNVDVNSDNYGGLFITDGAPATGTNYGVFGRAMHAPANFAGKFEGRVDVQGHPSSTQAADYYETVLKATVNHTQSIDSKALDGLSHPVDGYGIGVYGTGGYRGVFGFGDGGAYTGSVVGTYGYCTGTAGSRYGVYGYAYNPGGTSAVAVYGTASGATTNWAGYFSGDCYISSDLRIGTTTQATGYSLSVNGKVACTEVLVDNLANWPDYVFAEDYNLMSIEELEKSINENNHLPGVPSAAHIEENGLLLGDMQKKLMEKIEELTLYTIQQNKKVNALLERVESLEKENASLKDSNK